jgi:threonine dehydratase
MSSEIIDAEEVVTADDVEHARERVEDVVHRTPLDHSTTFAEMAGATSVGLKLENMQRTGSFKIRGAYNAMSQLDDEQREQGVVAASAGNHAQGVALAGNLLDIETTIVVPEVTPAAKIEATRGYGARVVVEGDIYERSYEHALDLAEKKGLVFVHPFNDENIIAGQGTLGFELLNQYEELDTVLVAIGGGGLISGIGTVLKDYDPSIRVIGVQPTGAAHAKPSLEQDSIHELPDVDTVAEGIADTRLLLKTFSVVRRRVDDVVTVTDREIAVAVALLAERSKSVAEAAGAAPLAALLSGAVDVTGENVAVVVSGGNADLSEHATLSRLGLAELGRYAELRLAVANWPAAISQLTDVVEASGAELRDLLRSESVCGESPNHVPVDVAVEGSGPDHLKRVIDDIGALDNVTVLDADDPTDGVGIELGASTDCN